MAGVNIFIEKVLHNFLLPVPVFRGIFNLPSILMLEPVFQLLLFIFSGQMQYARLNMKSFSVGDLIQSWLTHFFIKTLEHFTLTFAFFEKNLYFC